jgi:hypothetical protein
MDEFGWVAYLSGVFCVKHSEMDRSSLAQDEARGCKGRNRA